MNGQRNGMAGSNDTLERPGAASSVMDAPAAQRER